MRFAYVPAVLLAALASSASLLADPPPIPKSDVKIDPKPSPSAPPKIVFSDVTTAVAPSPSPVPAPLDPGAVSKLPADQLYIAVQSETPFLLFASPAGVVSITKESGPLKVRGKFTDGSGKPETRLLTAKYVAIVEATGTGRVELIAVPVGADAEGAATRKLLDVDDGTKPQPPPAPIPDPKPVPPTPKPTPSPTGVGSFVVVVADDSVNMTVAAAKLYDGPTLRSYKAAGKCRVYGSVVDAQKLSSLGYDRMMTDEKVTAPCALVVDKEGHPVSAFALTTEAELAAKLKEVMAP